MSRNIHPISPFVTYCQKVIPLAFDESLSYYEALCALVHYLKHEVTPAVNENADAVTELQNYVANYFDNLDVQEEINNKLDAMAEAGTLQEIIAEYIELKSILAYDSIVDMKSADNLIEGSFVQTYGFHAKNDGGSAMYKVRAVSNIDVIDEMTLIALQDETLVAELIAGSEINVKQLGAKGDSETDDTIAIQKAIDTFDTVIIPSGTFMTKADDGINKTGAYNHNNAIYNGGLKLRSGVTIKGENKNTSVLKAIATDSQNYAIIRGYDVANVEIKDLTIYGDKESHEGTQGEWGHGVMLLHCTNVVIDNANIKQTWGDGVYLGVQYGNDLDHNTSNIRITNSTIDYASRNGISCSSVDGALIENVVISHTTRTAPRAGIDFEPEGTGTTAGSINNITVENCKFTDNSYGNFIYFSANGNNSSECNISINNCTTTGGNIGFAMNASTSASSFGGLVSMKNAKFIRTGWSSVAIQNKLPNICKLTLDGIYIEDCDNVTHNITFNAQGIIDGSGVVIYGTDNDSQVGNIIVKNLEVVDTRSTKYTNHGFAVVRCTGSNIQLIDPIELTGVNRIASCKDCVVKDSYGVLNMTSTYYEQVPMNNNFFSNYYLTASSDYLQIDLANVGDIKDGNEFAFYFNNGYAGTPHNRFKINTNRIYPFNAGTWLTTTDNNVYMKIKKVNGKLMVTSFTGTWTAS